MSPHLASFLTADVLILAFIVFWLLRRRAYHQQVATVRRQRDAARRTMWKVVGERDDALRILSALRAEDDAIALTGPIPYLPAEGPVWTEGAPEVEEAFAELMHREFIGGDR